MRILKGQHAIVPVRKICGLDTIVLCSDLRPWSTK